MGTKEQCADSLTKFLRVGPDQVKAREYLSLVSLEDGNTGRGTRAHACGTKDSFPSTGDFGPRVCRVLCPSPGRVVSEPSGPGAFGPLSLARRRKRLCRQSKACYFNRLAAILAWIDQHFACKYCELFDRECIRTNI